MSSQHRIRFVAQKGFTLVETLMVMVVLGIAATIIISLQGNIFQGEAANKDMQIGAQLMHECAEQVLGVRRRSPSLGYTAVTTSACSGLGNYGGFGTPVVTLINDSGSNVSACASASCTATITVGKDGSNLTPITLRLIKY